MYLAVALETTGAGYSDASKYGWFVVVEQDGRGGAQSGRHARALGIGRISMKADFLDNEESA